jgi:hypothetical protein
MKREKLTKLSFEALGKERPCLSEEDVRSIVGGGAIGDWLRNAWWDILNFFSPRDCAFNSFIYVYNNNSNINPSGYQISYRDIVNGYIDQYGYPSCGGVVMGDFMNYVNSTYSVNMYQVMGGTIPNFIPTNILATYSDGNSVHLVVPTGVIRDSNGNPTDIEYYDPSTNETGSIPISQWGALFNIN